MPPAPPGKSAIDPKSWKSTQDWFRKAAAAGIVLNAARRGKLQQKRHALATRMHAREDDYLRFARDLRVPFDNNAAEQVIRMSKLRIKVSGCMRSMTGAETFCAIRSYLATAARHGIGCTRRPHPRRPGKPLDARHRNRLTRISDGDRACSQPASSLRPPGRHMVLTTGAPSGKPRVPVTWKPKCW